MKLLVDENLSYRMVEQFEDAGHDSVHVNQVGLGDTDDVVILAWAADRRGRVVITADADFGEMLALEPAAPSVVQLRSADHHLYTSAVTLMYRRGDV